MWSTTVIVPAWLDYKKGWIIEVDYRGVGPQRCRTTEVSDHRGVGLQRCWTTEVSDYRGVGPQRCPTTEVLDHRGVGPQRFHCTSQIRRKGQQCQATTRQVHTWL